METKNKNSKAFTIIELIVVIAIIAILAGIITTSVIIYIERAKDTAVKADVSQIARELQIYYAETGDYSTFTKPVVDLPCSEDYSINPDINSFAVYALLCSGSNDYWCVDSTGRATELTEIPTTNECVLP